MTMDPDVQNVSGARSERAHASRRAHVAIAAARHCEIAGRNGTGQERAELLPRPGPRPAARFRRAAVQLTRGPIRMAGVFGT